MSRIITLLYAGFDQAITARCEQAGARACAGIRIIGPIVALLARIADPVATTSQRAIVLAGIVIVAIAIVALLAGLGNTVSADRDRRSVRYRTVDDISTATSLSIAVGQWWVFATRSAQTRHHHRRIQETLPSSCHAGEYTRRQQIARAARKNPIVGNWETALTQR